MKITETVFFVLLFIFALNASAAEEIDKDLNYKIVLTNSLEKKVEVREFKCEDKIILYFTWFDLKREDHSLSALWYKPGGKLQETTKYNFAVEHKRKFSSWLWLKLEKGKERGFIAEDKFMKVSNLSTEEFKTLISDIIEEKFRKLLDPDHGLELREDFARKLEASIASKERVPLEDVKKTLGLV